jgi:2,3-bisphosphoglycerate-independent phosphoglycerate mutase
MIVDEQVWKLSCSGGLANIAPTVLQLMGLKIPGSMSPSLLLEALPVTRSQQASQQSDAQRKSVG